MISPRYCPDCDTELLPGETNYCEDCNEDLEQHIPEIPLLDEEVIGVRPDDYLDRDHITYNRSRYE